MCWYCGSPVVEQEPFGRSLSCIVCSKDLRSCRNCRFHLPGAKGDCAETAASAESTPDKERGNFCDWFSLDPKYRGETAGRKDDMEKAKAARTAFDNLFS